MSPEAIVAVPDVRRPSMTSVLVLATQVPAVDRVGRQLCERGSAQGADDDVAWVVDARVDAGVGDERGQYAERPALKGAT